MPVVEGLAALDKALNKKVNQVLKHKGATSVFGLVRDVELEMIDKDVYQAYHPRRYIRRDNNGGMRDPDNIVAKVSKTTIDIVNVTQPKTADEARADGAIRWAQYTTDKYLPELIEFGDGYKGYHYDFHSRHNNDYLNPRPFTQDTINELAKSKEHVDALRTELQKQGLIVL